MKRETLQILIVLLFLSFQSSLAQSARSFFKEGKKLYETNKFEEAIPQLTKAIELKPEYEKAVLMRAQAYEKTSKLKEAATDYKALCQLDPKEETYFYSAGKNLFELKEFAESAKYLDRYTLLEDESRKGFQLKFQAYYNIADFAQAKNAMDKVIAIDPANEKYYYQRAIVLDSLKQYNAAVVDYKKTIAMAATEEKYIGYNQMLLKAEKYDDAKAVADEAISKYPQAKVFYFIRAEVYKGKLDYPNAINDLSRVTVIDNKDLEAYKRRAEAYSAFNQFQSAISDFGKIIALDAKNYEAYFMRAKAYEEISNKQAAIRDYKVVQQGNDVSDASAKARLDETQKRLFDLLRESNKPEIAIAKPMVTEGALRVAETQTDITLTGELKDESAIKQVIVAGKTVNFSNNKFAVQVSIAGKDQLTVEATDVYDNKTTLTLAIKRNEVNAPAISVLSPFASENGEVYLEGDVHSIHVEGKIKDESLIKKISINGINASFSPKQENPKFTATVTVRGVETLEMVVQDIYGNETKKTLNLNREAAALLAENPMGKTWMVFIDNSNYETFASLEGPGKDVLMMKNALADYQIHNVIHKKDMTKKQMERFFAIELRDLIRSNRVNSLVVWYAGHGKFINETGYWIPVDAQRDDEFTYFNIANLKASMHSYSKNITHTLVITDACESGPSFYQAMRSTNKAKSCDDPQATRFKSSQVFSSAGYELASDNSQFTKAFAKALEVNANSCIAIEAIVQSVTQAVKSNNQQQPQFGKIYGMEDENGTFFFIKK